MEIEFDDWGGGEATDPATQETFISLELINVSEQSTNKLRTDVVSHVKIADAYYGFTGARKSLGVRNDWVVRCLISADRAIVQ